MKAILTAERVCSNSTWAGGELAPNYRKPSDMIAVSNQVCQRKKVTSPEENDLSDIWRPTAYRNEYLEIVLDIGKI